MSFAAGSYHGLRYIVESEFGTTPATPTMIELRHTSCGIALSKDGFQSEEIRSDRQISDFRHGVKRIQGDIGIEFSYGEFDTILEAALFGEWSSDVLTNGVTAKSFTFERAFTDIDQYGVFTGCMVNNMSLSIPANAMVTGSFGIIGKGGSYSATTLDASPTESQTHAPFDSFSGSLKSGDKGSGGTDIATITSIDLSIENGLEPAFVIGSDTTPQITPGRCNITGAVSAYFEDLTMLNRFINETESMLELQLGSTSNYYTILIPRIKYTGGDNPANGEGPLMLNMPFQALAHTTDKTIKITRVPPAE